MKVQYKLYVRKPSNLFLTITGMTGHIEWGQKPEKNLNGYSC